MKNLRIIPLFAIGLLIASCTKEEVSVENMKEDSIIESGSSSESRIRESETILSLDLSDEELITEIYEFCLVHNPMSHDGTFVQVKPDLEEHTVTMSLETQPGGGPIPEPNPLKIRVCITGADDYDGGVGCITWAIELIRDGCTLASWGEIGPIFYTAVDCP